MDEKNELQNNSESLDATSPEEPVQDTAVPDIDIPTLRTYKQDVSQTVQKDKITSAKILMAEQRKKELGETQKVEQKKTTATNIVAVVFGIILLVSAVGVLGYFGYNRMSSVPVDVVVSQTPSFLFVFDQEKYINGTLSYSEVENSLLEFRNEIKGFADKTYTEIIFYKQNENEEAERLSSIELFRLFNAPVVTNIARSISTNAVYGMYTTEGRAEPFLVVGLVDYENAYANMFFWENTLALDIRNMFPVLKDLFDVSNLQTTPLIQDETNTNTDTEDTTQVAIEEVPEGSILAPAEETEITNSVEQDLALMEDEASSQQDSITPEDINSSLRFTDIILSNQNTRAIRNQNGSPFFYYAFIDRNKILFAQDPALIGEIIRKIRQKQLVR